MSESKKYPKHRKTPQTSSPLTPPGTTSSPSSSFGQTATTSNSVLGEKGQLKSRKQRAAGGSVTSTTDGSDGNRTSPQYSTSNSIDIDEEDQSARLGAVRIPSVEQDATVISLMTVDDTISSLTRNSEGGILQAELAPSVDDIVARAIQAEREQREAAIQEALRREREQFKSTVVEASAVVAAPSGVAGQDDNSNRKAVNDDIEGEMICGLPRNRFLLIVVIVLTVMLFATAIPLALMLPDIDKRVTPAPTPTLISPSLRPTTTPSPTGLDRPPLEALYFATDGPNWIKNEHWLTNTPMCDWQGVVCDELGRVIQLDLDNNNMQGSIPTELGELTALTLVDMWSSSNRNGVNVLVGTIPTEIGKLTELTKLRIGGEPDHDQQTQISGRLPTEIGFLVKLTSLSLASNGLNGPLPSELGLLTNVESLDLRNNLFSGTIPVELSSLTALQGFGLDENDLIGNLTNVFCAAGRSYDVFRADCNNNHLVCGCCTQCFPLAEEAT